MYAMNFDHFHVPSILSTSTRPQQCLPPNFIYSPFAFLKCEIYIVSMEGGIQVS